MKKYLLATAILCSINFSYAASSNIVGSYHCAGTEVDTKKPFTCIMTIEKTKETYSLITHCDDNTSYTGTGIYREKKRIISSVFINPKNAAETGVGVTEINDDGSLDSRWTYLNKTSIGHATCTQEQKK
jgi:hypothetical protein